MTTLFGCQRTLRKIDFINTSSFSVTELRRSGFQVKHPPALQLSTHEDQETNFWYCKRDSLPPYSNTFAIGLNVPDTVKFMGSDLPIIEQVQSKILGELVNWNVRQSDTGYFVADGRLREMKFLVTAVTPLGIDSMISCVSTLSSP